MKRLRQIMIMAVFYVVLLCSCSAPEAYFSDAERGSTHAILNTYNLAIHPGDQLHIYVYSMDPVGCIPFNQDSRSFLVEKNTRNDVNLTNRQVIMSNTYHHIDNGIDGYRVLEDGNIIFPIFGKITAAGISLDSLAHRIENLLIAGDYVKDPVVTVKLMNFRVSVIGEVPRPQELHVKGERLTILEALAMCGDISQFGQRTNVLVVRDSNGQVSTHTIDLTKKTMFDSEVYYLQNNDIVYVEPKKKLKRRAYMDEDVPHYVSTSVAVVRLMLRSVRRWYWNADKLFDY